MDFILNIQMHLFVHLAPTVKQSVNHLYHGYLEELYVPHPIVGAINKNPEPGVILLDEKK